MTIRLHDSMTKTKRDFVPLDPNDVRMYVCGPTVYDRAHIGNARPVVVFDVLYRLLRHTYGEDHVRYVRNITDIDDKIMARAAERGVPIETVTSETTTWFQDDMAALGCLPPDAQPRATEHVGGMVAMIEALVANGKAYPAEGHVLFDVAAFPEYGRLSNRSTDDMIAGARVDVAPYKRGPMDFVLWKPSLPDQPGWDSPWGRGRPGWHIECSAMSRALLGGAFDIHGGGADLMFPHHENEIAQSVCAHPGEGFAGYWLHNGMVRVEGRKMSKSLGNFLTVEDMRAQAPGEVLRLALLMTHYRDPLDWTAQRLEEAATAVTGWVNACFGVKPDAEPPVALIEALADDLNTPAAVAVMHSLTTRARKDVQKHGAQLAAALTFLNLRTDEDGNYPSSDQEISRLLDLRNQARRMRDFQKADFIRDGLKDIGVMVEDTGLGTHWQIDAAELATALATRPERFPDRDEWLQRIGWSLIRHPTGVQTVSGIANTNTANLDDFVASQVRLLRSAVAERR